jgi:hypothetical protein
MPQKILPWLFVICAVSLTACRGSGPSVTVCILDPAGGILECGKADGEKFSLPLPLIPSNQTYVCLESNDAAALLRACQRGAL